VTIAIPDPVRFVLVLARVAGLLIAAPVLGHLLVPVRVRAGIAVVLAGALAAALPPLAAPPVTAWAVAGALVAESALGALLGLVAQFVFAGVQLGGQFVGIQMGFGMEGLIDPGSQASVTVVAQWHHLLALLVFLALDMHHLLVRALVESFHVAPPGGLAIAALGLRGAVALAGELFAIGVRVAAPVLVALLLTNGALGVLARTIPQLNVFVVGFPLNVGVGLVVMGAALPFTFRLLAQRFAELEPTLGALVRGLAHG
jgi:flagellar biosynthesis protein FliR